MAAICFLEAPQRAAYNARPSGRGDFSPDFSGLMRCHTLPTLGLHGWHFCCPGAGNDSERGSSSYRAAGGSGSARTARRHGAGCRGLWTRVTQLGGGGVGAGRRWDWGRRNGVHGVLVVSPWSGCEFRSSVEEFLDRVDRQGSPDDYPADNCVQIEVHRTVTVVGRICDDLLGVLVGHRPWTTRATLTVSSDNSRSEDYGSRRSSKQH